MAKIAMFQVVAGYRRAWGFSDTLLFQTSIWSKWEGKSSLPHFFLFQGHTLEMFREGWRFTVEVDGESQFWNLSRSEQSKSGEMLGPNI